MTTPSRRARDRRTASLDRGHQAAADRRLGHRSPPDGGSSAILGEEALVEPPDSDFLRRGDRPGRRHDEVAVAVDVRVTESKRADEVGADEVVIERSVGAVDQPSQDVVELGELSWAPLQRHRHTVPTASRADSRVLTDITAADSYRSTPWAARAGVIGTSRSAVAAKPLPPPCGPGSPLNNRRRRI